MKPDSSPARAGDFGMHLLRSPSWLSVCIILLAFTVADAGEFLNLDFELATPSGIARGWFQGGEGYEVLLDTTIAFSGARSLRIRHISGGGFGVGTKTFPSEDAGGKHLVYTGYIKTDRVTDGWAGLWWRVDGESGVLGFDNMQGRGPEGATEWSKYSIEMDVDSAVTNINFGVLLTGKGTAWFDALQVELDGQVYQQVKPQVFEPTDEQIAWVRSRAIVFETEEPGGDHSDLMPLKDLIGNTRIVALGEATHGTREFFKMKHRITEFLAEEMGFTVFAIEANMTEARAVNEYVLQGKGDPRKAIAGMYFWTWNTHEVLDMIEWMRSFNESGAGHIEFLGFDMQFPSVAMDSVRSFVRKADPAYIGALSQAYDKVERVHRALSNSPGLTDGVLYEPWLEAAAQVLDRLEGRRAEYLGGFDSTEVDWAIQNARIVVQGAGAHIKGMDSRDESMANNVEWILEHNRPDTKVVLWAHNGHVSKGHGTYRSMGSFLSERYGDDLMVLGFAFHEGEYTAIGKNGLGTYETSPSEAGSVEWVFHGTGLPRFILDLGTVDDNAEESSWLAHSLDFRSIGAGAMDYAFSPRVVTREFDALIYFDETHPSLLLDTPTPEP